MTFFDRLFLERPLVALVLALTVLLTGWLAGCSAPPPQVPPAPQTGSKSDASKVSSSIARNAKDYRQDAAKHLYALQKDRIYPGRMPPMLLAVGVLNVDIDRLGQVQALHWQRAPRHAPEVMAEIERMVKAAAPFPAPRQLGKVTYTDVWLWHQSGRFQLDTLTEGQD